VSRLLLRSTPRKMQQGIEARAFMLRHAVSQRSGERWEYVSFSAYRLPAGATFPFTFHEDETCVVVLGGKGTLRTAALGPDGRPPAHHDDWPIGDRANPFSGPPSGVLVAAGTSAEITTGEGIEFAIGSAPGPRGSASRALPAEGARRELRGSGAMERTIHNVLMEDQPASSLLVTEVVTPAGHWSSYPPHKHDTDDPPNESALEEIYYFRFKDPRGFGLMRVYTADRALDESIAVHDGDVVLVPRGYHTFSAAPGYEAYYLNVMAGPRREWKITFDPDHERMRW
jgi:5-deoxy-glucuronate isomerase